MPTSSKRSILITGFVLIHVSLLTLLHRRPRYVDRLTTILILSRCSPGGVGHDLAREFAAHGLRVFATARSTKSLSSLEEKGIETFPLDVTSEDSIQALKDEIATRTGGKLDLLFNNAGMSMY
jgi:NAD(P)-dependent dehydrogenase (short-subunit alcohol dehydrogenase family)